MTSKENNYSPVFSSILVLMMVFVLFQNCKVYQDPVSLEQAAASNDESYVKITMLNGDEYIYEDLELIDGNYYGIHTKSGEKLSTLLVKEEIKDVQRQNKKSSMLFNVLGITVGLASIYLGVSMF